MGWGGKCYRRQPTRYREVRRVFVISVAYGVISQHHRLAQEERFGLFIRILVVVVVVEENYGSFFILLLINFEF